MNFRQMRFVCEVIDRDLSISRAAEAMHTSQPSVSRQIQDLEKELGFAIFRRSRKRIFEMTSRGNDVARIARSIVQLSNQLRRMTQGDDEASTGDLTIAASHAYARYSLPEVIEQFCKKYPRVKFVLRQSDPGSNAHLVEHGEADLMISAKPLHPPADLVFLACREVHRVVLTPKDHPIHRVKRLTLEALSRYPLITYDKSYEAHAQVMRAFSAGGLKPHVVLTATDISVMKTYVQRGLGISIVASIAYQPKEDRSLRAMDAGHLFPPNTIHIGLRRNAYLPSYVYDFISMFEPSLEVSDVRRSVVRPS